MTDRCEFCVELVEPESPNALSLVLGRGGDWRMTASARVAVIPSIGPLAVGHVLVCPVSHVRSSADACRATFAELWATALNIGISLERIVGQSPVIFEHGPGRAASSGACIEHAHIHVVPVGVSAERLLQGTGVEWDASNRPPEQSALRALCRDRGYLLATVGGVWATSTDRRIRSQELRKVIARLVGNPLRWDWALFPEPELIEQTLRLQLSSTCDFGGEFEIAGAGPLQASR